MLCDVAVTTGFQVPNRKRDYPGAPLCGSLLGSLQQFQVRGQVPFQSRRNTQKIDAAFSAGRLDNPVEQNLPAPGTVGDRRLSKFFARSGNDKMAANTKLAGGVQQQQVRSARRAANHVARLLPE